MYGYFREDIIQCKNQLYASSDKLNLLTSSIGTPLDDRDQAKLQKGQVVIQSGYFVGGQLKFSLPVEIFCQILLNKR